ncbi:amino acid ABC transporter permease [Vitreoscilla stercoraria]|uniref:Amino acid ABC transporter permease n=2 Tax=Vitreoscilla stercoraria TaxID=61 RepID=A0ABY4EC38_VITST|nr:amino acid ABC transporter permease [Vitreoscilla stercoraria]UOO93311.1 amino acid ABC transporter permease [Vitreoscilla stercoraria]
MSALNNLLASLPFMTPERAEIVISSFWPMLVATVQFTIPLALASFVIGLVIAVAVAVVRVMPRGNVLVKVLYALARVYVSIIRGTPMLVQIFIIFYGLPAVGVTLEPFPTAIIAFALNVGAYASEIIRAAIESVHKGQWEAGFSSGMTYFQVLRHIVLPQAMPVSVPPLSNTFISLVKDTSLASLVLVTELFRVAQSVAARTYEFLLVYAEAAVIYWVICLILGLGQERLEKYFNRYRSFH